MARPNLLRPRGGEPVPSAGPAAPQVGRLPLHVAALNNAEVAVVRLLLEAHPEGAKAAANVRARLRHAHLLGGRQPPGLDRTG